MPCRLDVTAEDNFHKQTHHSQCTVLYGSAKGFHRIGTSRAQEKPAEMAQGLILVARESLIRKRAFKPFPELDRLLLFCWRLEPTSMSCPGPHPDLPPTNPLCSRPL